MNYQLIYGTNDLILAPIPEPSAWIGAALALAAIGFMQRRRLRGLAPALDLSSNENGLSWPVPNRRGQPLDRSFRQALQAPDPAIGHARE
jgi:hypothetical protein